jgi:catechol 2,3-dioxygenase-like lactoylglutathione lyase family enzyme
MDRALLRGVDNVMVRVPDLDSGLAFYRDRLGHPLLWRTDESAGLRLGDTELVLSTSNGPEVGLLVDSVVDACDEIVRTGGRVVVQPEAIPVGMVAVVLDPFGNRLTLVDLSNGTYLTDAVGRVTGTAGPERPG